MPARLAAWRRRRLRKLAATGFAGVAVFVALGVVRAPEPVETVAVVVAARDLPAGQVITAGDLAVRRWPTSVVPARRATDIGEVVGRMTATPVGSGEPVTSGRLVEPWPASAAIAERVVTALPGVDQALRSLVRAGDHVDVLDPATGAVVVSDGLVVADPSPGQVDPLSGAAASSSILLAVTTSQARALATAGARGDLAPLVAVRNRPAAQP